MAIQASRMSTHLHKNCIPRQLPPSDPVSCPYPGHTFFSGESELIYAWVSRLSRSVLNFSAM